MSFWAQLEAAPQFIVGARDWFVVACALAVIGAIVAIWSYLSHSRLKGLRPWSALAKILAFAALAFCLVEPMQRTERPRPGANVFALVTDSSQSMQMKPSGSSQSFADQVLGRLRSDSTWQKRLGQDFDVRRYTFDERLRSVDDFTNLEFDGMGSAVAEAIDTIRQRFASRPVAGMLLFSDGISTDQTRELLEAEFNFPVHVVVAAKQDSVRDISISRSTATVSAFELAPASIEVQVVATGFAGESLAVRLFSEVGEALDKQTIRCDSNQFSQKVRFQYRPKEPGVQIVNVRAMLASEDEESLSATSRKEITTLNNTKVVTIDRGGGPYRVLYVGGRPNWEFKFLRRALEEDVEIEFHGLVRIAKEEPKFSFRDQGVETSNPLLAGFSDDETAEQYDEPVLMKIGINEGELAAGFPSGEEELFHYDAIVLDDIEASFFTQQQMLLIREFVSRRGGGLMMLGGKENFRNGAYEQTPLGDVLPVYLRGRESQSGRDQPVRYRLTREGTLEPWLRLRSNQSDEQRRVGEMPDFFTWNSIADVKPGATVLASLETATGQQPGLVAQRFGKGRALALLVGDFWRWSMRRATKETDDLAQSWRQISRWLTSDVPKRTQIDIEKPTSPNDPTQIRVTLRDEGFKPLDNAEVKLQVTEPDGTVVATSTIADTKEPGVYSAEYWSRNDGGYRCEVEAIGPDGSALPIAQSGWAAQPSAEEFQQVEPNMELLNALASKSGGEVISLNQLESFAEALPSKRVPITESRVEPLWQRPWLIAFAIGCLCIEWGLRRWKGLP
ncbi:MAG: glutamine amidotransferase [Pirellulaceae bacterium]